MAARCCARCDSITGLGAVGAGFCQLAFVDLIAATGCILMGPKRAVCSFAAVVAVGAAAFQHVWHHHTAVSNPGPIPAAVAGQVGPLPTHERQNCLLIYWPSPIYCPPLRERH